VTSSDTEPAEDEPPGKADTTRTRVHGATSREEGSNHTKEIPAAILKVGLTMVSTALAGPESRQPPLFQLFDGTRNEWVKGVSKAYMCRVTRFAPSSRPEARGLVLRYPTPGWAADAFRQLLPGGHAAVFGSFRPPMEGEDAGFEVRDCLTVLGSVRHHVWLLRKPLEEGTVAAQAQATRTGGIWIDGCRVGGAKGVAGRWPTNLLLVHMPGCRVTGSLRDNIATNKTFTPKSDTVSAYGRGLNGKTTAPRWIRVAVWTCVVGCPALTMDLRRETPEVPGKGKANGRRPKRGRSRFLPQFADETELDAWLLRLILGAA
jgi:hypothetical protein